MTDQDLGKWGKYVVNPPAETKIEPVSEIPTSESNLGKWAKYEVKKKDEPTSVPSFGSEKSLELPSASTGNKNESDQPLTFIQKELRDKGLVADENAASVNSSNDAYKSAVFAKIKDPEQQKILGKSIDEANKFFANLGGRTPFQKIDEYNDGVKKLQASITPEVVASMDKNGISNLETQLAEKSKQLAIDLGLDTDDKGNVYVPKNEQAMYDQKLDDYVATETAKSKKEQGWFSNMIYGLAGATQTMSADLLDVAGFMTGLNYFNSYKQLAEGDRFNAQKLTEKSAKYDQSIQGYLENGDVVSAAGLAVTKSIESIPAMMPVLLSSLAPEAMAPSIGSAIMGATSAAGKYRSIENENVPEWKKIYNAVSTGAIMMGAMHEFGTTLLDARKAILDLGETAGKQAIENAAKKTMFSTLSDIKLPSYIRGGLNMTALGIGTDITDKVTVNPELKIGSHMVDDFVVGALMDKTFALPQDLRKGLDYKQTQKFATEVLNKLPDDLDIETKISLGNKIVERDRLQQMEDKLDPKFKGKYETQLITLNSEIDKAASNYLGKAKVEEVPDLSVGKMDEVGNEQEKLDYLKDKEVKVPDGATMEQLNALYEETKAKEQAVEQKQETPKPKESVSEPVKVVEQPKPSKPIEQMTSEEIRSFSNEVKQHEKNIYSDVFGEKADRFRQLEQSSNNPTKTKDQLKAIDSEMQQMIDELPKEERDIWDGEAEYNASDLRDTSRMVGLVEESENISELSSSLKNPLMTFDKKNPKKETLAIFNAAVKRAQELGISTEELIGQTSKLIAKEFKDPKDAMDVVKSALESISKPLKTEQDAGKIGEKADLGSQEKALIEGEDRGVRLRNNEKPRMEAEAGVVEAPKQEVTQNISETNIKTTKNGKNDAERQRGQGNQEGLLTPEENVTVMEPQNIEAPTKTQKIKAKSAEIASAIRSKRFYTSMDDLVNLKGDIAPIELIKTAWDGSLNVAAGIVEVGGEAAQVVSDAISAAVKHLEASEWYKGLSDESKAIASQKLSDEIKLKTKDLIEEANQEPIKVNVGEGEKISSVGKRIVESTKLPQEIKDQFAEEGIGYIPTSKAMRTEEAKEIIKAKLEMGGRDEVRNQILDTKNGIAPNVRVTMASIFASESLREYANAKTLEEATKFRNDATDVMQFAMEYGESLGKGVQAFTDIADMLGSDPELIGEVYRKEINKRNKKFYEKHDKNIKTAKQIIDEYLKSDEFLKKYGEKRARKEGEITPKERKERGMAKAANAINRIADLVHARLNFEGEIEKGDNIYKAVVDLADGLLDIGVSSIQELSSKMKVELRKYLTSEQVDKISKDVFSEIKANDRLTVRKKIIKIEESDAKKIVDKLYSKMVGVSQRQLAKLLSENIELLEKEGSISDQAFKELFAKSLGQDHIKDGMLDKLKSNAKKINDVKNIEESISKLFDEAAEVEKNGTSKERILELKKQINRKIKEHAIATFEAAKANQYISESFAKPTTIAERAAAHIKGNLMVPASLVSNVISNLTWVPTRKVKNGFQMLFDLSLNKVGSFREHIQNKIIKNIQDFQESESQRLGIPKEDVVVPKNLTDAMNILDKLPTSQRTKIQIGLNRDYMIGFGKGLKESIQQMWTGALGDDIKVRELGRAMHPLNALFDNIQMLKGKEEFETKKFIYNSIEATLGVPPELIFRALNFGDKPFRRGEERSRLAEIADIKGLTGIERRRFIEMPDAESVKIANDEGLQSIYAQGNLPSKVSTSIDRWLATHKTEEFGILDRPIRGVLTVLKTTSIPYIKTPVNILMETLDYAIPEVAFTKALIYASKGDRYKFTDSMARGTVGLVINNMIWSLFANGILSLAPGGNEEEKKKNVQAKVLAAEYRDKPAYYVNTDAFMRHLSNKIHGTNLSTEWQQGDEISSYKRYGIWSAIMMGQAEMYRGKTPEEIRNMSIMERSFVSAPAIITSALDQSFVTGISALLNAVTGTGAEAESWVMNTTRAAESIAIPSTIRAYQQATDNQMRETRDKTIKQLTPRMVSRIKNDFKSSYMVDNGLASKVTIWGEKVKRFEDGTNVALQLFDLNKTKIYKGDFGTKIFELYEKTKDKDVLPEILKPSIRYKKENVTLDPQTFEEYQIYVGQMLRKRTESLVNSMEWESMSDDSKIKSLRRLFVGDSSRRGAYMDSFVRQNRGKLNELWINQFSGEKKK